MIVGRNRLDRCPPIRYFGAHIFADIPPQGSAPIAIVLASQIIIRNVKRTAVPAATPTLDWVTSRRLYTSQSEGGIDAHRLCSSLDNPIT